MQGVSGQNNAFCQGPSARPTDENMLFASFFAKMDELFKQSASSWQRGVLINQSEILKATHISNILLP